MNLSIIRLLRQQVITVTRIIPSGGLGIVGLYYFFPSFRVFAHDFINYVIGTARSIIGF